MSIFKGGSILLLAGGLIAGIGQFRAAGETPGAAWQPIEAGEELTAEDLNNWPRPKSAPRVANRKAPVRAKAASARSPRARKAAYLQPDVPVGESQANPPTTTPETVATPDSIGAPLTTEFGLPPVGPEAGIPGPGCDCGNDCGGCDECGGCEPCGCCPPLCGPPGHLWAQVDYLLWWTSGMDVPPLVTTSPDGTANALAGVLGVPGTQILFGGQELFTDARSGARIRFGVWLDPLHHFGIEADWLFLGDENENFSATSLSGDPILMRPFFNVATGMEDAEEVGFPGDIEGVITVETDSSFNSGGIRLRCNLCCTDHPLPACFNPGGFPYMPTGTSRIDFLVGYRYASLRDAVRITERLNVIPSPPEDTQFDIFDHFDSANEFHGVDVGYIYEFHRCRWSFEMLGKIAFGNNHQRVRIDGQTTITTAGIPAAFTGGLLAQRTNIGNRTRDRFSVIPEIGLTAGYRLTNALTLNFGYSAMLWSSVARAGSHIDRAVDPGLLPPEVPPVPNATRPAFAWRESTYFAQGLNFGLEYRW